MADVRQLQAWSKVLQWVLLAAGASALALLVFCALQRLVYPFELEWMEGAIVQHSGRVASGEPIYTAPSVDHVAFLYTPLLYQLGALLSWLPGPAYLPLRLVSLLATLACALQVWSLVRRETGGSAAGLIGAGLFLAGYGLVDSWYDLARNDTLFLALLLWCLRLLRWGGPRALVAAGGVFCLAFLAKQTALILLPPLLLAAAFLDWRRALWFGTSATLFTGVTVLGYHVATDGWFTWFVFEMPRGHSIQTQYELGFWTDDLLPLLPAVALALGWLTGLWRSGRARLALFHAAAAGGLLMASYVSRLHAGGHVNALMYALLGGAALSGAALTGTDARLRLLAQVLCAIQFALLAYGPARFLPRPEHRAATEEFVAFLGGIEGDVFVPFHGNLNTLAGKPAHAHLQAIGDALYGPGDEVADILKASLGAAFAEGRFAAVVLDQHHVSQVFLDVFRSTLGGYRPRAEPFLDQPERMAPIVGMWTHPVVVLERAP